MRLFLLIPIGIALISDVAGIGISDNSHLFPVIIVPGQKGSQLEARLDKPRTVNWLCAQKSEEWFRVWFDPKQFLPRLVDCFIDNVKMYYNSTERRNKNAPGVEVRPVGWGQTEGLEFLSTYFAYGPLTYFYELIEALTEIGYVRNKNIRGAPYDFRSSPHDNPTFVRDLKALIEETVALNNDLPVIIVCHSMGCMYSLHFFQRMSQRWKDQHVKLFFSISGSYGGTVKAVEPLTTGINFARYYYDSIKFRELQRTCSSTYFLLPKKSAFGVDFKFIYYVGESMGIDEFPKLFQMLNLTHAQEMYDDSKGLMDILTPPGVDTFCTYGVDTPTPEIMIYRSIADFPERPSVIFGPGDGSINLMSLAVCEKWKSDSSHTLIVQPTKGLKHTSSPRYEIVISNLIGHIKKITNT